MWRNPIAPRSLFLLVLALLLTLPAAAQSFLQSTVIPTGNWPTAIYTADMNGDGYPDLIYLDHGALPGQPSTTHVLLNNRNGSFTQSAQLATIGNSLAIGDLTGTGHVDLGWLSWTLTAHTNVGITGTATLTVAPSRGDGTFSTIQTTTFPTIADNTTVFSYLALAPFHFKAPLDVLAQDTGNSRIYAFQPAAGKVNSTDSSYSNLTEGPGPVSVIDLNNDGHFDIVVNSLSKADAQVYLLSTASGTTGFGPVVQPTSIVHGSGQIHSLLLEDVNFDGIPDLIAEGLNGRIDVYPGNGDGTFATSSIGGTGSLNGLTGNGGHLITLADLNHDGQLDALTATPAGISTLFGAGTAYLKLGGIYNAGPGNTSYVTADFNQDGNLDLAIDSPEGIAILYGNADGTFQTSRAYAAGQPALSGVLGVFTTSGKTDAAVSTAATQAQFLRGAGDGTFTANPAPTTTQTGTPNLWSTLQAADFDGDGYLDLLFTADGSDANLPAIGSGTAGVYLQHGDGSGNFADLVPATAPTQFTYPAATSCVPPFSHYPGQFFGSSVAADFNADGIADFANRDAAAYRILRGNNGSATSAYTTSPSLYYAGVDGSGNTVDCHPHAHELVATADFDHDGHPDLLFQGSGPNSGALLLYLATANLNFPLAGDLSVDGSLTTPGQFTAPNISSTFGGTSTTFSQPYFPGAMTTADLDNDGNQDLLVTYANLSADPTAPTPATPNYLYIWYGSGGGKFLTSAAHPVNPVRIQLTRNYYQVAVADLNHDGIPDLILSDGYILSHQLGLGDGTFGPEVHLLAGRGINTILTADLRGTGSQDLVLANGGAALSNPVANHESLAADPDVNTGGITVLLNTPNPQAATATLTVSPEPSVFYSPYTLTATSPTQAVAVTFSEDGVILGTVTTTNGTATYTVPARNEYLPGQHTLTASVVGTFSNVAVQATATHTINRAPTTVTLTPTTPLTVYYGQAINGTFNISGVDPTQPPTGSYTLLDNGTAVAICTAIPIAQSCPYGAPILLDAGPHVFSIQYLGDTYNAPSTSPNYPYQVLPDLTSLVLASSTTPAYLGQPITLTSVATGNVVSPVGTVTFSDGAQLNQTAALAASAPTTSTAAAVNIINSLAVGNHTIVANYPGTLDFNPAASNSITQQILPDLTTLTLTSSLNPATRGDAVTFSAVLTGNYLPPYGTVNFLDNGVLLGSGTNTPIPGNSSLFTFTTSTLAVGTHPITAVYAGNSSFNPAISNIVQQVIQPVSLGTQASITTLTSNLNPSAPQQLVTFTAQVQVPGVFATIATGIVTFLDGTTPIGTATLSSFGVATFQTSSLKTGTHQITASYAGAPSLTAPTILPSVSTPLAQVVTINLTPAPTGFQMTATPAALTLGVGRTGVIAVNILDQSGFNQPVALSCSNLAPETTCVFTPAVVPAGGGIAILQLFTNAPRDCNTNTPYFLGSNTPLPRWPLAPGGIVTALTLFAFRKRRRLAKTILMAALAATLTTFLSGCGHCTDLGTRPGNYTFQLIGTAQGGPIAETRTIIIPLTTTIP